mgnify:CR=1 FL=1
MLRNISIVLIISIALLSVSGCFDDNQPPVSSFTIFPENVNKNSTIYLNSTSTDADGSIENVTWYCNEQFIGNVSNITYFIEENGSYTFTLIVEDNEGLTDSSEKSIIVGSADSLKEYFIGSWEWSGNNQTGLWIFYQNNTLKSTFQGIGGASVTYWWHFEVNSSSEICFNQPSDPKLNSGCYDFEFKDDYTTLLVNSEGNTAEWHKIR